jgi:hypothetical protein
MREGVAREWRGSQAAVLMHLARVRTRVAEGARLWSGGRWCGWSGWRMEMEAETMTPCALVWPSQYHKYPCLKSRAW